MLRRRGPIQQPRLAVGQVATHPLDAETLRGQRSLQALRGFVGALAYSPDGQLLAVAGQRGQVTLWDARTLRPAGDLKGLRTTIQAVAFSPDGQRLAVAEIGNPPSVIEDPSEHTDGNVRVWDVKRRALTDVHFRLSAASIAFSPDGSLIAAASFDKRAEVRDARSGRLVAKLPTAHFARSLAFSPDSGLVATGHYDGTAQLWSTESWKPVGGPLEGHDGKRLLWMEFSRDGTVLATGGQDGTVALWDVQTRNPIGPPLMIDPDAYVATALTPDGSRLFAVSTNRRGVRWDVSPDAWKRHACRLAGRDLSPREWADAVPDQPYRTVCRPS